MDSELGEVGYAGGHPIVEIYVGRDRKAYEKREGGREGVKFNGEIDLIVNAASATRVSPLAPTIKLARGDSPRKFSIFFSEPMFPEIEIGKGRKSRISLSHCFDWSFSLINFQIGRD